MEGKWIALSALGLGVGLIVVAINQPQDGAVGLDRLPFTILMAIGGGALIVGSCGYFVVRGFMAL